MPQGRHKAALTPQSPIDAPRMPQGRPKSPLERLKDIPSHVWIPLLNHYSSYRRISKIGEIDCPTPKRFNSPLFQSPFCILGIILSNN